MLVLAAACTCLITALLGPGEYPNVKGGFQSTNGCSKGTFFYRDHYIILSFGVKNLQTFIKIHIPKITQSVTISYCLMDNKAYIGTMIVPVTIHTREVVT